MEQLKNRDFDKLRTPFKFYCTFEHMKAAKALKRCGHLRFGNHDINVKPPKNPTDILWMNAAITDKQRSKRVILAVLTAALWMLIGVFALFVTCTEWRLYALYTYQMNGILCDEVRARFGDNLADMAYVERQYMKLSDFSVIGTFYPYINERLTRTGAWQCLCDNVNENTLFKVNVAGETEP